MNTRRLTLPSLRARALLAAICIVGSMLSPVRAQSVGPAPDTATLARYDRNRNGTLDADERVSMERDRANAAKAAAEADASTRDEVVSLSPFQVTGAGDRGYYAANTMSATRLNSKIEDLAASITVVTKEQMADFAMLDINDIFAYEAGTEGTGNFTDFTMNASANPIDNTQVDPSNANRIRGVGSANISLSNFETSRRVPIDPINIDAVEISRGPNSNIFGLGDAAGTVNMVASSANLSRNRSQVQFRGDTFGGYRASLDVNRVLKPRVLSMRGSMVYQHDGYNLKPSGTDTVRLNGMVKFQPLKSTTLSASFSTYRLHGNRPNATMPRDGISFWKNAGSPTWDPMTQTTYINGQVFRVGGTLPNFFQSMNQTSGRGASLFAVDYGVVGLWTPGRATLTNDPNNPNQTTHFYVNSAPENVRANQPLFSSQSSVSSKEIYDWTKVNLAAMNSISDKTDTTTVQLEHIFLNRQRHLLAMQLGWMREDSDNRQRLQYGTPGSSGPTSGYLQVDPNIRLLTDEPNPHFLQPYIGIPDTIISDLPLLHDTYRGQLAYRLNLAEEKNWVRWLGMHQLAGYAEYKDHIRRKFVYRDAILSDHAWLPANSPRATGTSSFVSREYMQWYVGDSVGQNVDYAPKDFPYGTYTYTWGNALTGQRREQATIGMAAASDSGTAGTSNIRKILKTRGGVIQSHLLDGRIITTFGMREDKNYVKRGVAGRLLADGRTHDFAWDNQWSEDDWNFSEGPTRTAGVVVKPLRWVHLHANKSDSFQPANPAINLQGQYLGNPSGLGEDYGFSLSLFDGKLILRANQYKTTQLKARNGPSTTFATRAVKNDIYDFTDSRPFGLNYRSRIWIRNDFLKRGINPSESTLDAEVAKLMQMSPELIAKLEDAAESGGIPLSEHDDLIAKGREIEIHYNPSAHWTMKLNVTEQEALDANLAGGVSKYLEERMPVWKSIIDTDTGLPWFTSRYIPNGQNAEGWLAGNVTAGLAVAKANEGKSRPQIRKYRVNYSTNFRLSGLTDHRILKRFNVGGAARWEDKGAIGYYGVEQYPAVITALDRNRPIYDKAHLYVDLFAGYRTKLFGDKVGMTVQLNVRNVQEGGRLQPISAFPNGVANGFRIIDPRQYIFTATFDL
jgi:hypothetical protein